MPSDEHKISCGGEARADEIRLSIGGRTVTATLEITHLETQLLQRLSVAARDLVDIAAYVYAADAAIKRGALTEAKLGASWRRRFSFLIPVRRPELWSRVELAEGLAQTPRFLSDDFYSFEFVTREPDPFSMPQPAPGLLTDETPDTVMLFSGGLDSLSGALDELINQRNRIALVTHGSSSKLAADQRFLVQALQQRSGQGNVTPFRLKLNLKDGAGIETSHRTRSFLFAAIAAAVADTLGKSRIVFFENGVLSINLPISRQLIGARATRWTHPKTLAGFEALFAEIFQRPWQVRNPFLWRTKTEVVGQIADLGAAQLIRETRSCASIREMTKNHPHCGVCSQCLDRRFAVLAAGLDAEDPALAYAVDPIDDARSEVRARELALGYVHAARQFARMRPDEFLSEYGEVHRALKFIENGGKDAAERLFNLHQRHGRSVSEVVERRLKAAALGEIAPTPDSLVSLVGAERFQTTASQPEGMRNEPVAARRHHLKVNSQASWVELDALGRLTPASSAFVIALTEEFLSDRGAGRSAEDFRAVSTAELADRMGLSGEEVVRKRLTNLRKQLRKMLREAALPAPDDQAVVENVFSKGYRLNPDHVDIVLSSDA